MNKQFLIDLKRGKIEEKKVFNYYKKYYSNAQHVEGYEKKYDIIIPEKFSIEVKLDERSKISGNYFIEAFYENSPSGINATTAKLFLAYAPARARANSNDLGALFADPVFNLK